MVLSGLRGALNQTPTKLRDKSLSDTQSDIFQSNIFFSRKKNIITSHNFYINFYKKISFKEKKNVSPLTLNFFFQKLPTSAVSPGNCACTASCVVGARDSAPSSTRLMARSWGEPPEPTLRPHHELGRLLGIIRNLITKYY